MNVHWIEPLYTVTEGTCRSVRIIRVTFLVVGTKKTVRYTAVLIRSSFI